MRKKIFLSSIMLLMLLRKRMFNGRIQSGS